ncbi:MAG: sodium/proline symporter [Bifidobacteriaceae bacterium]|jgi:sodium/proline symporter|nr:sodium/proline symporter [Bifidobacteriaceae bacterium]
MYSNSFILLAFIVYAVGTIIIGVIGYRKVKTTEDYIIGSRSLGTLVSALSAEAADMSAWLFMGLPGAIYLAGTGQAWIAVGLLLGTILNWLLVAKRIRNRSQEVGNATTIPEFFANISQTTSKKLFITVRVLSSSIIIIYFIVYTASGFVAGGKFFSYVFGTDYFTGLLFTVFILVFYTFLGGFLSISWNSVLQGLLMLVSILVVPVALFIVSPGSIGSLAEASRNFITTPSSDIISSLAWALGYFGMPHILIKYMAQKDITKVRRSATIAITWCFISLLSAVLIGILGVGFIGNGVLNQANSENLFFVVINYLFIKNGTILSILVAGFFFCAVLSAIMSTAATQLLMISTSSSVDIYSSVISDEATDEQKLDMSRFSVIVVAFLGFIMAINSNNTVMGLVSTAWAGFGAVFGPLVLLSLYWKKITAWGSIFGMLTGLIVVLVWPLLSFSVAQYSILPGFISSALTIIIVSKITYKKPLARHLHEE